MIEIRIHGRGGQGAVIASKILATAAFSEGKHVQAFPFFGVERRGAPVTAFVRIGSELINLRSQIYKPDHIIVLDHTLLNDLATFEGLKENGWVLINTKKNIDEMSSSAKLSRYKVAVVDAGNIAIRNKLGSPTSPIVNTGILGAFSKISSICSIDSICKAIEEGVPLNTGTNTKAAREAYDEVKFS